MAQPCAELLFLSGPQEGQRAVLIKPVMLAGRAEACDVLVADPSASRQHLRFEATADGCLLEVLSARGVRINGKSYKPAKNILLDSGDCLALGAGTEILFVAAGDDPEAVLAEHRKAHPSAQPPDKKPPPPPPPPEEAPAKKEAAQRPGAAPPPSEVPDASPQERARRAKVRKYAVLGGVYALAMVGLVIFLSRMKTDGTPAPGSLAILADRDIEDAIAAPLTRGVNDNLAAKELQDAQAAFDSRNYRLGNLQNCVKHFKLHLAYLNKKEFEDSKDSTMFLTASRDLAAKVKEVYRKALIDEGSRMWREANQKWEDLRLVLPKDQDWNTDAYNKVVDNLWAHAAASRQNIKRR